MSDEEVEAVQAAAEQKAEHAEKATRRANWAGWVVIILAVVFVAQGLITGIHQQQVADCNFRINNQFREQIERSRETNNDQRQALIDMVEALRSTDDDQVQAAAMDRWLAIAKKQQQQAERIEDQQLERCR